MARGFPQSFDRERILIEQRGLCLYCSEPLDGQVFRKSKVIWLCVEWDHMVPYSYGRSNASDNWAASCQVCNGIKSNLVFDSIQSARDYIMDRRERLGITVYWPSGVSPSEWEEDEDYLTLSEEKTPVEDKNQTDNTEHSPVGYFANGAGYCSDGKLSGIPEIREAWLQAMRSIRAGRK